MKKLHKLETTSADDKIQFLIVSEETIDFLFATSTVEYDYGTLENSHPAEITYILGDQRYIDRGEYNPLEEKLNKVQQSIRDLRDSDNHHCPANEEEDQECTCGKYDEVIDIIDRIIKEHA